MEYQHWLREAISQLQASESPQAVMLKSCWSMLPAEGVLLFSPFGETQLTDEQCQQLVRY